GEVNVEGQSVPAIAGRPGFADLPLPILAGRYPTKDDEIALGARSAELLGVGIGDRVSLRSQFGDREALVSGLAVLPSLGPFQADRAGLGTGALLSSQLFAELVAAAEAEQGAPPGSIGDVLGAFVAIDLRDGADAGAFVRQLRQDVATWDVDGFPPHVYPAAVRPPEVADVAAIRAAPALLAALLAATMAVALVLAVMLATRARRRELAILRALGCTARQLQASVAWHTVTVVGCGLVIGLVIGVATGSTLWRQFAGGLGVVPSVDIPEVAIAVVAVAAVAVALIASAIPAITAARSASADQLREC
ncbi:MAG TPA: ABC transporter permease, partial [Acidimicrobiales bacterium]|nr:ABC transporter permease [Acidimicrobiales bacterium]